MHPAGFRRFLCSRRMDWRMAKRFRGQFADETKCAVDIAYALGDIHLADKGAVLKMKKQDDTGRISKATVTITDIKSQERALEMLKKKFSKDAVIAEEETLPALEPFAGNDPDYRCWIIDPLDGSYNHSEGRDSFGVALGLRVRGQFVLSVLYSPVRKTLYLGVQGQGVRKISPQTPGGADVRIAEQLLSVPKQGDIVHTSGLDLDVLEMIYEKTGGINVHVKGLASIDRTIQVVEGTAKAYVKREGTIYGIGPESFIVTEAGGTFIDLRHRTPEFVLHNSVRRDPRTNEPILKQEWGLESFGIVGPKRYCAELATTLNELFHRYRTVF